MKLKVNIPELSYSWDDFASDYPSKGKPDSCQHRENADKSFGSAPISEVLLYYDTDGSLVGILHYFPVDAPVPESWMKPFAERAGSFNLIVHPERRRRGIGVTLLREAVSRWPINFEKQNYTEEGAFLVHCFLTKDR